ncbi:hypothetical protein HAX54_005651, partial [Datura stramonium]|nr:hypothetical protein [Datura stramonium]
MVRQFLANWMSNERSNQVKIRDQIIVEPNVDPQPFIDMVNKPPYRNIRHTLCGPNSVARWTRHQQSG